MVIQCVVEGYGEIEALPTLLRRLSATAGNYDLRYALPIRQNSSKLMTTEGIARAVELALQTDDVAAILIVFDGDLDLERGEDIYTCFCPKTDLPALRSAAQAAARGVPCEVVVAVKEFEAWFLAGIEGLALVGKTAPDAQCPTNFEVSRSPKALVRDSLLTGNYNERTDQPALAAVFDIERAHQRSRSFRKLIKTFGEFHSAVGSTLEDWPPQSWNAANDPA